MEASGGKGVTFKGAASIDTRIRIIEASVENTVGRSFEISSVFSSY